MIVNDSCIDCDEAFCGDGFIYNLGLGTEECDDGNFKNNDNCITKRLADGTYV